MANCVTLQSRAQDLGVAAAEDTAAMSVLAAMGVTEVKENIMNMIFVIENTTLTGQMIDQIGLKIGNVIVTLFLVSKWRTMSVAAGVVEVWWSKDIRCLVAGLSVRVMGGQKVRHCHNVMANQVVLVRGIGVRVARLSVGLSVMSAVAGI